MGNIKKKFKAGAITATIWENQGTVNEQTTTFLTTSIERNYKDGETWKSTSSFRTRDLPDIIMVSQAAYEFIRLEQPVIGGSK